MTEETSLHTILNLSEVRSRIFAVVVAMVQDYDLAEDLFQESIAEILKSESKFDPSRSFAPWACGIARNVVRQHWRRSQKSPATGVCDLLAELSEIVEEGDNEQWKRERRALRRCFQRLPERMQNLLMLRYGHNIKGQSLADSASIRVGSIRTTLSRLRAQLQTCIHAYSQDGEVIES